MKKRRLIQKSVATFALVGTLGGLTTTIAHAQSNTPKLRALSPNEPFPASTMTAANGGRWIKVHHSDYGITMADETSIKSVGPNLREILTLSSGRGGLDVSLSRQVYNCRSAEYKEVETALVDANGRIGAWAPSPLANKMVEIPHSYKYAISVFFHACFSKRNLMDVARTFPEAVTFLRNNTPKP
jgi:hypothetical protein